MTSSTRQIRLSDTQSCFICGAKVRVFGREGGTHGMVEAEPTAVLIGDPLRWDYGYAAHQCSPEPIHQTKNGGVR